MHADAHIYIYLHIHTHTHTHTHTHKCACARTCADLYIRTCVYTSTYVCFVLMCCVCENIILLTRASAQTHKLVMTIKI